MRLTLGALADGALDLAEAWDVVGYHCGDPTDPASPAAIESATARALSEHSDRLIRQVAHAAALYVTAATQHLRTLATLRGPELVLTGWTITRSLAEYCGRAGWLLSPDTQVRGRLARYYMEEIVGIQHARVATERAGNRSLANELRKDRKALIAEARKMFLDADLYVNNFGGQYLNATGLYDVLSSLTHPSLHQLRTQTKVTRLEERTHYGFVADPDVIRWQFAVAAGAVYRAGGHVAAYLAISEAPLEQWADRNPQLLSAPGLSAE